MTSVPRQPPHQPVLPSQLIQNGLGKDQSWQIAYHDLAYLGHLPSPSIIPERLFPPSASLCLEEAWTAVVPATQVEKSPASPSPLQGFSGLPVSLTCLQGGVGM